MMTCEICHARAYSNRCAAHKQRGPIARRTPLPRPTRRVRQHGKQALKWVSTRQEWIKRNWSPGVTFTCHYCPTELTLDTLTLDHKHTRSRHPELRYQLSNLVPACEPCNLKKGSIDHDDYPHNCPDLGFEREESL